MRGASIRAGVLLLCGACTGADEVTEPPSHPEDDRWSLADVQAVGTHNSYHVQTTDVAAWEYTHAPLDVQVRDQGVRQFELDLYFFDGAWVVQHLPFLDEGSTCDAFSECLDDLVAGSESLNRQHVPLVILLEPKQAHDGAVAAEQLALLDADLAALGSFRILPTEVDGAWPALTGQRGRFVFVWHARGSWRETALEVEPESIFFDGYGDLDAPRAAVHSLNDPTDPLIPEVVAAGHLVRTRSDSDGEQARANDTTQRDAAFASGAHFISTDFPVPHPETGYVVEMPPESAVRCNPVSASDDCGALLLEDPAVLEPS